MNVCDEMEACKKQAKTPMKMTCLHHVATCATFAFTYGVTPTKPQLALRLFFHEDC